jgi:hypothetical protein
MVMARPAEEEFHTEVAKIAKGHSKFTSWRGLWLNGRSTRWARQAEEEFHTEVCKDC